MRCNCSDELEQAVAAGAEQLQAAKATGKQLAALAARRDGLRQRLVQIGEEHRAALIPQLEVKAAPQTNSISVIKFALVYS